MQFALGIVTILALLMTIAMGMVTSRLVREERRRSAARLAALTTELKRHGSDTQPSTETTESSVMAGDAKGVLPTELFGPRAEPTDGYLRRAAGIAVAGLVLVAVISTALVVSPGDSEADAGTDANRTPVELLALAHEQQDGSLAITGTVRNPLDGPDERRLSVLAMAFDDTGTMVARGRAPLALERLAPGTESAFVVSLPTEHASRFRISFVVDDTTVPHLDRRVAAPVGTTIQTES